MQLKQLRKEIKPLGFKVLTESLSWGRLATFVHIESGEKLTFNVATQQQIDRWKPLHDYLKNVKEVRDGNEKIYGTSHTT